MERRAALAELLGSLNSHRRINQLSALAEKRGLRGTTGQPLFYFS